MMTKVIFPMGKRIINEDWTTDSTVLHHKFLSIVAISADKPLVVEDEPDDY